MAYDPGVQVHMEGSWASSPEVCRSMQSNRGRDTKLELRVRSALHREGLRFRKHVRPLSELRCTADVVFPRERLAVFIDACYWHSCPMCFPTPSLTRACSHRHHQIVGQLTLSGVIPPDSTEGRVRCQRGPTSPS